VRHSLAAAPGDCLLCLVGEGRELVAAAYSDDLCQCPSRLLPFPDYIYIVHYREQFVKGFCKEIVHEHEQYF